jgi:hypothetical protein
MGGHMANIAIFLLKPVKNHGFGHPKGLPKWSRRPPRANPPKKKIKNKKKQTSSKFVFFLFSCRAGPKNKKN